MKEATDRLIPLMVMFLASCFGLAACSGNQQSGGNTTASPTPAPTAQSQTQTQSGIEQQQRQAEQQARPEIEKQRKEAEQQAAQSLDKEAVAAIDETQKAIAAIAANKTDEALAAIERATGKTNILLARNPATALIPVGFEVEVTDAAPADIQAIRDLAKGAETAVSNKDYPVARVLLYGLTSEVNVRTYNLPLGTYPDALKTAARLLDQKNNKDAATVLLAALNTLVVIDRVRPLPLVIAQAEISDAEALREKDKDGAQKLLEMAKNNLERGKELGYYAASDQEYTALNQAISDLQTQLKGNGDTASAFTSLKEKVAAFFKRLSEIVRR